MLTPTGFKRLRVADYLPIIQEQARELFGETADLSDRTPLGRFIYLQALQRAEDNELAEQIWNSRFIDTSTGAALEANVKRALITKTMVKSSGPISVNLKVRTFLLVTYLKRRITFIFAPQVRLQPLKMAFIHYKSSVRIRRYRQR